ncbi:hypothetical protein HanXRQr2_Chr08g0348311 [Helianthus annuus]|uniref:Uncharacterized protein n=1 Tax=Helianthus annuus TaxID=4232 RepID=A0A9K3IG89_HELAN|nr:hypothetical protein HanXRQr2_Chr08g0348311 [Helianthus annuus]
MSWLLTWGFCSCLVDYLQLDRFITNRSAMDFDYAHCMLIGKKTDKENPVASSPSRGLERRRERRKYGGFCCSAGGGGGCWWQWRVLVAVKGGGDGGYIYS